MQEGHRPPCPGCRASPRLRGQQQGLNPPRLFPPSSCHSKKREKRLPAPCPAWPCPQDFPKVPSRVPGLRPPTQPAKASPSPAPHSRNPRALAHVTQSLVPRDPQGAPGQVPVSPSCQHQPCRARPTCSTFYKWCREHTGSSPTLRNQAPTGVGAHRPRARVSQGPLQVGAAPCFLLSVSPGSPDNG